MIIAHNEDFEKFQNILNTSLTLLKKDSKKRMDYYLTRGVTDLEKDIHRYLTESAKETIFENNIELISGQRFPDIVAYVNRNKAYGVEVKTTKQNKWKSVGSSIFEGTRVEDVQKIQLLFAKLVNPIEFKCRSYEECLYDVAITHSPRYLIDMNIEKEESIFHKIGVTYDELRDI